MSDPDPLTTLRTLLPEGALSKTDRCMAAYDKRRREATPATFAATEIEVAADAAITELATIAAEALKNNAKSICIFCGETMSKDIDVMFEHARGCDKRPENRLLKRAEAAESALEKAVEAINWACGCGESEFRIPAGENVPRYWWRGPLTSKAGLAYNKDTRRYDAAQCKRASAAESALEKAKAHIAEERDRWEWVARDIAGAFDTRDAILADAIHRYDAAQKEASDE